MNLDERELKELDELIELFDEGIALNVNFDDGKQLRWEELSCFKLIKEIIDGRINRANVEQEVIRDAKEQMTYVEEFFTSIGYPSQPIFQKLRAILE